MNKVNFKKVLALRNSKGFTLIELLVVVAIIGILASVVLASLNTARTKGSDAAIKAALSGARAQAELFYDTSSGSYLNVCTTPSSGSGIKDIVLNAAQKLSSTATVGAAAQPFVYGAAGTVLGNAVCHDSAGAWAAIVSLKGSTLLKGWCVDSAGASAEALTLATSTYACP